MTKRTPAPQSPRRRELLQQGAALGIAGALGPTLAFAQGDDLAPYRAAKINWQQAEGETITVAVIPASYFENLISLHAAVRGAHRHQAALREGAAGADPAEGAARPLVEDGDLRDARGRPDVLPALRRRTSGSSRSITYLNDATLTDAAWFNYDDIIKAWRDADSRRRQAVRHSVRRRGDGAGLSQGPLRRQGPEARRHLRASSSPTRRRCNDPPTRASTGSALRGFAGAGQNMYIYPSLFRGFGGNWCSGNADRRQLARKRCRRSTWYVDTLTASTRRRRCATGTGPTSPTRSRRARSRPTSTRTRRRR